MAFLLKIAFWVFLFSPQLCWAALPIASIEIEGEFFVPKETILRMIPLKVGEIYEGTKIERAITQLEKWGIFDKVEVQSQATTQGMMIRFFLHESFLVTEVSIVGNYPYIETKIRKRLTLNPGNPYSEEKIQEQIGRILQFYERQGYPSTQVTVRKISAPEKNAVRIIFKINRGEGLRLRSVQVTGNAHLPSGRFLSVINPWKPFSDRRLSQALSGLEEIYRKKGFLRAQVKVQEKQVDEKRKRVDLVLAVREGPRVHVLFEGKKGVRSSTLKKVITLYRERDISDPELQESKSALETFYQERGFPQVKISVNKKTLKEDHFLVRFDIEAGHQQKVTRIAFSGNEHLSSKKLKSQLIQTEASFTEKGYFKKEELDRDRQRLGDYYKTQGFLEAKAFAPEILEDPKTKAIRLTYTVEEGPRSYISKIEFEGNKAVDETGLRKLLKSHEGEPISAENLKIELESLRLFYADHGYPHAQIEQNLDLSDSHPALRYRIEEGVSVTIGEILTVGDALTGVKAIHKAMNIKEGDPFSYQKIVESELALRRLGVFNAVKIETVGLEEKQDRVHLIVKVEERKPFVLDLDAQYTTDTQYAGSLRFTNFNSFGWAKHSSLLMKLGLEGSRGELGWLDPKFFGLDFQMAGSGFLEYKKKPTRTTLKPGGAVAFFRQYHRFGFLTRYELARIYILEGVAADPVALRDSTLSKASASVSYDTRRPFADPLRGYFVLGGGDILNEIAGQQANFAKMKAGGTFYWSPFSRITISHTARGDRIQNILGSTSVPSDELFFLGGDDSIRGFKEDSLGPSTAGSATGGRLRLIYNGEVHLRLVNNLQWALFYDAGSLTNEWRQLDESSIRHSTGFGLRYITPIGPIRTDFGFPIDRRQEEPFWRFHLTFGYPL